MPQELGLFLSHYGIQSFVVVIIGYLLGSVNFSIIITRRVNKNDIRSLGSKNAGFTNVLRSVGKVPAIITFAGDFFKCILAILIAIYIFGEPVKVPYAMQYGSYLAGVSCVVGHIYPCFFKFKGGKGIVTAAAMILFIDVNVFAIVIVSFLIVMLLSGIISISSIIAAIVYPIATFLINFIVYYQKGIMGATLSSVWIVTIISAFVAMLVVYKHKSNIQRILRGEEKRISAKK